MLDSPYEITNTFLSQLSSTIETIVFKPENQPITEYQLIKLLQSGQYHTLSQLHMGQADQLFQLHFIIFHTLYNLRKELLIKNKGYLEISPLCIKITHLKSSSNDIKAIEPCDPLADYYLNLENLINTTSEDIEQLILSFWKNLYKPNSHLESLKILELCPPVSYKEIKKQYKRLASKHHPDKGGSKLLIQDINQAMATLNHHYKNGKAS